MLEPMTTRYLPPQTFHALGAAMLAAATPRTLQPLDASELAAARENEEARLTAHMLQRDIDRNGYAIVLTRDAVSILAVRVMVTWGVWSARETTPDRWCVERVAIETDPEPEEADRGPLAVDASIVGGR